MWKLFLLLGALPECLLCKNTREVITSESILSAKGEYYPKAKTRDILLSASVELRKSTVWKEVEVYVTSGRSELTPVADAVVHKVEAGEIIGNIPEKEPKLEMSTFTICMEDLMRLVAPQFVDSKSSWLNDNIIGVCWPCTIRRDPIEW